MLGSLSAEASCTAYMHLAQSLYRYLSLVTHNAHRDARGNAAMAQSHLLRALEIARTITADAAAELQIVTQLAMVCCLLGKATETATHQQHALQLLHSLHNTLSSGTSLLSLGRSYMLLKQVTRYLSHVNVC